MNESINYQLAYNSQIGIIASKNLKIKQLQQENKQLKNQKEELFNQNRQLRIKLEHHIPEEQYKNMLHRKNQQLKQRDEVIDELKSNILRDIDGFETINEFGGCNDILDVLYVYKEILQKYKGDNK